ncbi:MAG: hypothetical protein E4H14_19675, partial [Candidatus Thorarchaeota archaeon]
MLENMWDFYQIFFERHQNEHERGSEALSAFMDLRRLLEPYWTEDAAKVHPIRNIIGILGGGIENIMIGFAARLRALEGVEGYPSVLKRLANSREYSSAEAEVET